MLFTGQKAISDEELIEEYYSEEKGFFYFHSFVLTRFKVQKQ